ncbi:MAG: MBL fold metallo-hydrolase [bacterium]
MLIQIFNVGHGFCALVRADNGNSLLVDCGSGGPNDFKPSRYLPSIGVTRLQKLVISNYDEDHMSDLAELRRSVHIEILAKNCSINPDQLEKLKAESGPIGSGMSSLLDMLHMYTSPVLAEPDFAGCGFRFYHNQYPGFQDTNNLSLVTFVKYGTHQIVFPGDLETAGWDKLLERSDFRADLACTTVFVASHHGRRSGYCPEVFGYCSPGIIIVSDSGIQYDTQVVPYDAHARGISLGSQRRYVYTTRKDGDITLRYFPDGRWEI